MNIKTLELSNFQAIEKFSAKFEGNVYFITGDNEVGKSTLLKAIGVLLTGNRDSVLRNGETKGFANMVVGGDGKDYKVELRFTEKNPRGSLKITSSDGMTSNNVSMLQNIFGYTDFDAVEFSRWSETAEGRRKQVSLVKSLLSNESQRKLEQIDSFIKSKKEQRKAINTTVSGLESQLKSSSLTQEEIEEYSKPVDAKELMEKQSTITRAEEKSKAYVSKKIAIETEIASFSIREEEIKKTSIESKQLAEDSINAAKKAKEAAIKKAEEDFLIAEKKYKEAVNAAVDTEVTCFTALREKDTENKDNLAKIEKWLNGYEKAIANTESISEQIEKAQHHNQMNAKVSVYNENKNAYEKAVSKKNAYDNDIARALEEKEKVISDSNLPIEGLSFTDDGLELNNVPFVAGKVSDSQIMEVATKLIIASNPTVKVFRVARGESLGGPRLKSLLEVAKKEGFQGFIEEVKRDQDDLRIEEFVEK